MVRIALFFSGRIHGYDEVMTSLKNLKSENTVSFLSVNLQKADEDVEGFCKLMNITDPGCINIEPSVTPNEIYSLNKHYNSHYDRVYSMFYNNFKCFEMMTKYQEKYNMKFDIIVRYRADIASGNVLPITLEQSFEENTIYIPYGRDNDGGLNDHVAYGNYNSMKKYCDVVNNILKFCNNEKVLYHAEIMLLHQMKKEKINVKRFQYETYLAGKRYEFQNMK